MKPIDFIGANSMAYDYDLFVIGAGSGGVRASRIAASHGARVAVAEEYRVGGTCVIRGCVPKKMLVYGSHFAEDLEDAKRFGWDVGTPTFDWPTLRDNVLADVDRLEGAYTDTLENHDVDIFKQRADCAQRGQSELATLCPRLAERGITQVEIEYNGYGDSGTVESVTAHNGEKPRKLTKKEIDQLTECAYSQLPGGWEINEGSFGTLVLTVQDAKLVRQHNWRIEDSEYEEETYDL